MNYAASQIPVTDTYVDTEKLIYRVCHGFRRCNGGEFDELVGEAHVAFMNAYHDWTPGGGMEFTSYLGLCIYRRLIDWHKKRKRQQAVWSTLLSETAGENGEELPIEDTTPEPFDVEEFKAELSADAQTVINFLFNSPRELVDLAEGKGGKPVNWRSSLREFFTDVGWASSQVTKSFDEIREALKQ